MQHWLVKSEPHTWSWADQKRVGTEPWDGVRNYQAANNMKTMKIGDLAFFYHSVNERRIVGIVKVVREYYPDSTDETGRFGRVDFAYVADVVRPITLQEIKDDPRLGHLSVVRQSRLSVSSIDPAAWNILYAKAMGQ